MGRTQSPGGLTWQEEDRAFQWYAETRRIPFPDVVREVCSLSRSAKAFIAAGDADRARRGARLAASIAISALNRRPIGRSH